jgi:hypothetical protein
MSLNNSATPLTAFPLRASQLGREVLAVDHDAVAAGDADLRRGLLAAHHVERMNPGALGEADDVLPDRGVGCGLRDPVALAARPEQTQQQERSDRVHADHCELLRIAFVADRHYISGGDKRVFGPCPCS